MKNALRWCEACSRKTINLKNTRDVWINYHCRVCGKLTGAEMKATVARKIGRGLGL